MTKLVNSRHFVRFVRRPAPNGLDQLIEAPDGPDELTKIPYKPDELTEAPDGLDNFSDNKQPTFSNSVKLTLTFSPARFLNTKTDVQLRTALQVFFDGSFIFISKFSPLYNALADST